MTTRKIRNGAVNRAKLAPQAVTARAHASIGALGSVNSARSRNITQANVTYSSTRDGTYCFHDLPFEPVNAVASSQRQGILVAAEFVHGSGCPSGTILTVFLVRRFDGEPFAADFSIVIF